MRSTDNLNEAARVMTICNACRYCEGHCAVFQAMELRLEFNTANLDYLANLCHNCGSCYHNCQYAPPHAFNLNVAAVFADLRQENYAAYAWPAPLGRLFANNGLWVSIITALMIGLFLGAGSLLTGADFFSAHPNQFYGVISHNVLVTLFGSVGIFVLLALSLSIRKFWRAMSLPSPFSLDWGSVRAGVKAALSLKYLDGGNGQGCSYPNEKPSMLRRWFHQATFWGFMLCFAATSVATLMHYGLQLPAPYGYLSLPKLLGITGGLGLIVGPIGLMVLKRKADSAVKGRLNAGMDSSFLVLLLATSVTGLLLMLVSKSTWVGPALCLHLGFVMALFLSMPYGKFVHGFYRLIALVAFAIEQEKHQAVVGVVEPELIELKSLG